MGATIPPAGSFPKLVLIASTAPRQVPHALSATRLVDRLEVGLVQIDHLERPPRLGLLTHRVGGDATGRRPFTDGLGHAPGRHRGPIVGAVAARGCRAPSRRPAERRRRPPPAPQPPDPPADLASPGRRPGHIQTAAGNVGSAAAAANRWLKLQTRLRPTGADQQPARGACLCDRIPLPVILVARSKAQPVFG